LIFWLISLRFESSLIKLRLFFIAHHVSEYFLQDLLTVDNVLYYYCRGEVPKSKQLTLFEKGQIIAYNAQNLSIRTIANLIGRGKSSVESVTKRYRETGEYERLPGSGRKRKILDSEVDHMVLSVKRNRKITLNELREGLAADSVHKATISRALARSGRVENVWQTKKPFVSNKNQKIRKKWCQERKNWTIDDWKKVLWSDESPFVFRFNQRERVWKLSDEKFHPSLLTGTVKHDDKIMVWGCFCWYGTGRLYKVRGIMEKMQYKSILQREMLTSARELYPDGDFIFQQDNDPKHTSKVVKRYLEYKDVNVLHWPAQSPDLNPIENLWSILDKMAKDRRPQNEEQLFQILDETWKSIPINYLRNLVESMPRRCQAVLDANGLPTKY
jgi:transposase